MTNFALWLLWIFLQFPLVTLQPLADDTQPLVVPNVVVPNVVAPNAGVPNVVAPNAGAPTIVGESLEPCENEQMIEDATVLSPTDQWEQILTDNAKPGDVFLLREGIYQANDKMWLPAGSPGAPITIKPYDCAAVTIHSSLRPNSHNIIAGLRLEATGISDTKWAIRFDGLNREPLTTIVIRNNTLLGGTIDAVRINDDVTNVTIQGNHIDGGRDGHDIFVTSSTAQTEPNSLVPDSITITQNRLTKRYFSTTSEDMFQVRDVGMVTFTYNTCTDGYNMEQCVDIKSTTVPLLIAHNFFDGDTLHQTGGGEDGSGGCMVIHEDDGVADQHLIEHNFFHHCKGTVVRFAPGNDEAQSSAIFRYNLLVQQQNQEQIIPIESATDVQFLHNTVLYGVFKLGNSNQSRLPRNLIIKHNIFYRTFIEDNLLPPEFTYTCTYNLLFQLTGTGFKAAPCDHTITDDPRFVSVAFEDLHLQATSPALSSGENSATIGALPLGGPPIVLDKQLFLPIIRQ